MVNRTARRRRPRTVGLMRAAARLARGRRIRARVQGTHYFKRQLYIPSDLLASGGTSLNFARGFSLSQLPGVAEFTTLFDQYRILKIKARWMPRANSAELYANNTIGSLFTVVDYDDVGTPTAINDLMQYQNLKTTRHVGEHVRVFKPQFNVNTGLTGNRPSRGWLDMNDTTIVHHGIKGHLQGNGNAAVTVIYDCILTFWVAFKNVR